MKPDMSFPTLGFLTFSSQGPTWIGCAQAAVRRNANLIGFSGWWLDMPFEYHRQANTLYHVPNAESLDGLIVWTSALGTYVGQAAVHQFCQRFQKLPMVSMGMILEGTPSILVDNYQGIHQLVSHLLNVHGCRRFILVVGISSNPEIQQQTKAYRETLEAAGLSGEVVNVNDETEPSFEGLAPLADLLDKSKGSEPFDAVVVANSSYTPPVLELLNTRGLSVPGDVALVSFGQSPDIDIPLISLTHATNPFEDCARMAVDLLLDSMGGIHVPQRIVLPTRLILGETCGCSRAQPGYLRQEYARYSGNLAATLQAEITQLNLPGEPSQPGWSAVLFQNLLDDIHNQHPSRFLPALEQTLSQAITPGRSNFSDSSTAPINDFTPWQQVITILRRRVRSSGLAPSEVEIAEDLLHQAREMVAEKSQRIFVFHTMRMQDHAKLDRLRETLAATYDLDELTSVLARGLPEIGIPACYLVLYEDPSRPDGMARLLLACDENGKHSLPPGGIVFPVKQLIPPEFRPQNRRFTFNVESLYFREKLFGFIVFEITQHENNSCQLLRSKISTAIQGARLFQQAETARELAEQANQLKSRFLSSVSHELRTPLALVAGLSEIMLAKPQPASIRDDVERIHNSAQHLDRLIRDVLDLASSQVGQLRLLREPLDMVELLRSAALMGETLARQKGLAWQATIPDHLPRVWGDRTRIRQIILNLISNAVKFTEEGHITLKASSQARMITIWVIDSGMGIQSSEQIDIFNEFHRSEEVAALGISGLGLGLAISKRLVEYHGGTIGVQSSGVAGEGSTFWFSLPILDEHTSSEEIKSALPKHGQPVTIVSATRQEAVPLLEYLSRQGFNVEALDIESTPGWVDAVASNPPGAIVLNIKPGVNTGWQNFQILKENSFTQNLPILLYTLPDTNSGGAILNIGVLTKPVEMKTLLQAVEQHSGRPKTILVVDDDPNILAMHLRVLRTGLPGVHLLEAPNGHRALKIITREQPDLILLDLMMPEMDGFGVLEAMQSDPLTRGIPVVVLTAQILTEREIARLNHGVAAVLSKGIFSLEEMLTHVEAVLGKNKRLGNERQRLVRKAMVYIHEHYHEELSRPALAKHVGVSDRYLTRCFSQDMGISPSIYLTRYRIEKAKQLLVESDMSISEIAYATGFTSVSYFGLVFRQQTEMTPHTYRSHI